MWCPRCKSTRVQRGYNDSAFVLQLAGLHELLCNNCGLEFKGFDPLRRFERKPSRQREAINNRRRFPRFKVRLPATIALVDRNPLTWDVSYSASSRGQCETISQGGMALAFVGSRFPAEQLTRPGCPLYVTVNLPAGIIAAVVSTITCERIGPRNQQKWFVGTVITQMSDSDAAKLGAYLAKQGTSEPLLMYG
jgi:predicted Zn-ribbon and HTH transcriptional regulator